MISTDITSADSPKQSTYIDGRPIVKVNCVVVYRTIMDLFAM
jgi:hypothetical protein